MLSTLVFWVAARVYVLPNLARWTPQAVLLPILLLHSLRHLGLMFLAPGATYPGMPDRRTGFRRSGCRRSSSRTT